MQPIDAPDSFPRSVRFAFHRRLGEGGFGVVYEADDHERSTRVALKTLQYLDAAGLYNFKREFRALCDVIHPNLVALHELISEGDRWFFTMDLVEGTDFLTFVRGSQVPVVDSTVLAPLVSQQVTVTAANALRRTQSARDAGVRPLEHTPSPLVQAPPPDAAADVDPQRWIRLRGALRQLTEGLIALHAAGKLHRDLKPSNVLVTSGGRVVILDFGLVMDLSRGPAHPSTGQIAGTPAYMAPEQALAEAASPANDWYSVGVMLYEALTGKLPFEGAPLQVLLRKQREEPTPPSMLARGIPKDLEALCVQLLSRIPDERPSGSDVLHRLLSASGSADQASSHSVPIAHGARFVGRERHLAELRAAFRRAKSGWATTVHVRGVSGMGKSALVRHFLDELTSSDEAVILTGRCYEREALPYKAVDSLIDSLSRYLSRLPELHAAQLMPRDVRAVVRLFPVLDRVKAIASTPRRKGEPARLDDGAPGRQVMPSATEPDAQELRRRGFAALRELLSRITDRKPLVLHIDDLQWGDADSAALLAALLREPDPPALLLLLGYRSDDAEKSEMLRSLPTPAQIASNERSHESILDLRVGALEHDEALALALHVLGDGDGMVEQAETIAREAAGSPFFVQELSLCVREGGRAPSREVRLETVLASRLSRLPADARSLLEVVSIAGRPLGRRVARDAAALSPEQERAAMGVLRAEYVLRARGVGTEEELETYHDRIRETTLAQLDAKDVEGHRQEVHLRIGRLLRESRGGEADNEDVFQIVHHSNIGASLITERREQVEMARLNLAAGKRAMAATAFQTAAAYFRAGVKLLGETGWDDEAETTFALSRDLAECETLNGHLDEAEALLDAILSRVKTNEKRGEVLYLRVTLYHGQLRYIEAMAVGRAALALFGIHLPDKEEEYQAALEAELAQVSINLRGRRIDDLIDSSPLTDPEQRIALRILAYLWTVAFVLNPVLLTLVSVMPVNITLKHGHSEDAAYVYVLYGFVLATLGRYQEAYEFSRLGLAVNEKDNTISIKCRVHMVFSTHGSFCRAPLRLSLEHARLGVRAGPESGDLNFLSYAAANIIFTRLSLGDELGAVAEEAEKLRPLVEQARNQAGVTYNTIGRQLIACLRGRTKSPQSYDDTTFDEASFRATIEVPEHVSSVCWYHASKVRVALLVEDYAGAVTQGVKAERALGASTGYIYPIDMAFHLCLAILSLPPAEASEERVQEMFTRNRAKVFSYASGCPENFLHRTLLIEAEEARTSGNLVSAMDLYDQAIKTANTNGFLHDEALANEFAARFYLNAGREKVARVYMTEAHQCYRAWGASAKIAQLEERYGSLLAARTLLPQEKLGFGGGAGRD